MSVERIHVRFLEQTDDDVVAKEMPKNMPCGIVENELKTRGWQRKHRQVLTCASGFLSVERERTPMSFGSLGSIEVTVQSFEAAARESNANG